MTTDASRRKKGFLRPAIAQTTYAIHFLKLWEFIRWVKLSRIHNNTDLSVHIAETRKFACRFCSLKSLECLDF
jgi:hypothetical protein